MTAESARRRHAKWQCETTESNLPYIKAESNLPYIKAKTTIFHGQWGNFNWYFYISLPCCFGNVSFIVVGPGSSVGIATELRAGRSGIESRWGRDFAPVQTGPGDHPASCKMGTGPIQGVKCGRYVLLTTHLLLVPRSWKSRAINLSTLWATPGL